MKINLMDKINRLNELARKKDIVHTLPVNEVNEQTILREEIMDYMRSILSERN